MKYNLLRLIAPVVAAANLVAAASHQRNPIQSLLQLEDPVIKTNTHKVNSLSQFDLDFGLSAYDNRIRLTLEPNHDIIPNGATVNHVDERGEITYSAPIHRHHHKVFHGTARAQTKDGSWATVGRARITLRRDGLEPLFEGAFTINRDNHHILLTSSYLRAQQPGDVKLSQQEGEEAMVVFRDSDMMPSPDSQHTEIKRSPGEFSCHAGDLEANFQTGANLFAARNEGFFGGMTSRFINRRQIDNLPGNGNTPAVDLSSTIGQKAGCPTTRKVALVGVATDCGYTAQIGTDDEVTQNVISVMNSASGVFESAFSISLGLQNLTIMRGNCPGSPQAATPWNQACSANLGIDDQLNLFSAWRNTLQDTNSHWTLLTTCQTGSAVGLAWVGRACTAPNSGAAVQSANNETVAGANVVALTGTEWQVIAHETGHTFGAVHDCDSSACGNQAFVASGQCCPYTQNTCDAGSRFIMNPYTTQGIDEFSPCTIGNICSAIGTNTVNTQCLSDNRAVSTITGQTCGNGIVEGDEQCDCGDAEACADDPCCNGSTCMFQNGAVCDDANEDCCNNCQFSSNGTVCRASTSSCDPAETCPGNSGICPKDVSAPDGQSCSLPGVSSNAGPLACASGQCTSRNLQCMTAMGSRTSGTNDTYACDDSSCTLSCGSPAFGANVCYQMNSNLLEGTPCGGGGHCSGGNCIGSDFGKEVGNWIRDHQSIVIGVAVAVGVLVLIFIVSCCCTCSKRRARRRPMPPQNRPNTQTNTGWFGPNVPQPPQMQQQQNMGGSNQGAWGHGAPQPGWSPQGPAGYGSPPPYPQPPQQSYFGGGNGQSARYA